MWTQDEELEKLRKKRMMQRHSMYSRARLIHSLPKRTDEYGGEGSFDSMSSLKTKSVGEGYTINEKSAGIHVSEMTMDDAIDSATNSLKSAAKISGNSDSSSKLSEKKIEKSTKLNEQNANTKLNNPNGTKTINAEHVPESNASKPGYYKFRRISMDTIQSADEFFNSEHHMMGTEKNTMKMKRTHSLEIPSDSSSDDASTDYKDEDVNSFLHTTIKSFQLKEDQHQQPTQQAMCTHTTFEFPSDKKIDMTFGRRIALYLMTKGYYPYRQPNKDTPKKIADKKLSINSDDSQSLKSKKDVTIHSAQIVDVDLINDSLWGSFVSHWLSHKAEHASVSKYSSKDKSIPSVSENFQEDKSVSHIIVNGRNSGSAINEDTSGSAYGIAYASERSERAKEASIHVDQSNNRPSLETAWAYFEHVALPRYVVQEDGSVSASDARNNDNSENAEIKTKLYNPLSTPMNQMTDFGIETSLYFYNLCAFMMMTLIAGLINIPNLIYFIEDNNQDDMKWYLRGSAVCNSFEMVRCVDCQREDFDNTQLLTNENGANLFPKFTCGAVDDSYDNANVRLQQSLVSLAATVFIVTSIFLISLYLNMKEASFQKDKQNVQDYSIVILNPPADAINPEEWKTYFENGLGHDIKHNIQCCTIAIGNDELVRALVQRREVLEHIKRIFPGNTSQSLQEVHIAKIANLVEKKRHVPTRILVACGFHKGLPEYYNLLRSLNETIISLASKNYPATSVFLTFETKIAKKQALSALAFMRKNRGKRGNENHLFREHCALHAEDATEPSSIRWENLNITSLFHFISVFSMTMVTFMIIVLAALAVKLSFEQGTIIGAIVVAVFNLVFPTIANVLTSYESHKSNGTQQISFYAKILFFSLGNTAVVTTIITPLLSMKVLLDRVFAIFIAELVTSNGFQLIDLYGNCKRHCIAPKMTTQEAMNRTMEGHRYDLATRYANMMKILFLTLWYCSVFPLAFFMCSLTFCVNYYVDRFSLMRTWKQARVFKSSIPRINQQYLFPFTIGVMALLSAYFWAGKPFDNICKKDGPIESDLYQYCNQNIFDHILSFDVFSFMVWSTNKSSLTLKGNQAMLIRVYLWLSLLFFGGMILFLLVSISHALTKRCHANRKPSILNKSKECAITLSNIPYIPKVKSKLFTDPLIACPVVDTSDSGLLNLFEKSNLALDLEQVLEANGIFSSVHESAFCRISYWT